MKIAATIVAVLAAAIAGYTVEFGSPIRLSKEGAMILMPWQAQECADGEGCTVYSDREIRVLEGLAQIYGWKQGKATAPSCKGGSDT